LAPVKPLDRPVEVIESPIDIDMLSLKTGDRRQAKRLKAGPTAKCQWQSNKVIMRVFSNRLKNGGRPSGRAA